MSDERCAIRKGTIKYDTQTSTVGDWYQIVFKVSGESRGSEKRDIFCYPYVCSCEWALRIGAAPSSHGLGD